MEMLFFYPQVTNGRKYLNLNPKVEESFSRR